VITQVRRATTQLLIEALGDSRVEALRAQAMTMDTDRAVTYALGEIRAAQRRAPRG
jgi:hypothetical protein